jgi:hypothetical protein
MCKLLPQTRKLSIVLINKLLTANHNVIIQVGVTYKYDYLKVLTLRRGPSWLQSRSATQKIAEFHEAVIFRYH